MRLWSFHPKYLDRAGLLASWREGLLAKACLEGNTKGYQNHPQLLRFKASRDPILSINSFLNQIYSESLSRKYNFDSTKISKINLIGIIPLNKGQLLYEWNHFLNKIKTRDIKKFQLFKDIDIPESNPIFQILDGNIESWEKIK